MDAQRPGLRTSHFPLPLRLTALEGMRPIINPGSPKAVRHLKLKYRRANWLIFDAQFLGGHLQSFLVGHGGSLITEDSQAPAFTVRPDLPAPHLPLGLWTRRRTSRFWRVKL